MRCPWHGWELGARASQCYAIPQSTFVRRYEMTDQPAEQLAKGPFVADTFAVSLEDDDLIVET